MKVYGYCRISTHKQSIDRQIRNIKSAYPEAVIIREAYSGTTLDRPAWARLHKAVHAGDCIVFDSVSRMSRDAAEGFSVYQDLYARGVDLVFLKEPHINTETYKTAIAGQLRIDPNTGDGKTDNLISGIAAAINRYLLDLAKEQIRLAFDQAEKEVADLHQRTKEGIETARLNGKQIGRQTGDKLITKKSIAAKDVIRKHCVDFGGSLSDSECIALAGCSRNSYYKYKSELRQGMQPA